MKWGLNLRENWKKSWEVKGDVYAILLIKGYLTLEMVILRGKIAADEASQDRFDTLV